jgi:hypothetical protein
MQAFLFILQLIQAHIETSPGMRVQKPALANDIAASVVRYAVIQDGSPDAIHLRNLISPLIN